MIIRLTRFGGKLIYVNVDKIRLFVPSEDERYGTNMDIDDGGDSYTKIQESPEEVWSIIRGEDF